MARHFVFRDTISVSKQDNNEDRGPGKMRQLLRRVIQGSRKKKGTGGAVDQSARGIFKRSKGR